MKPPAYPKQIAVLAVAVLSLFVMLTALRAGSSVAQEIQPAIEDLTPPELISLDIDPDLIDTDGMDGTITVTLRITDDLSGVERVSVRVATTRDMLLGAPGQSYGGAASFDPAEPDVTIAIPVTILQYSKEGEWGVWTVRLYDRIGNDITYYHPLYGTRDVLGNPQDAFCERNSEATCLPPAFDKRFTNYPDTPLATPSPGASETPEPTPTGSLTPMPVCTPPPCPPPGSLVCGLPEGCPGGCGTICQTFDAQLPLLWK